MKLKLTDGETEFLKKYLEGCSDCEFLSAREVVLDLYDNECPVTMNFVFVKGGIGIDGAAKLLYSEEEDGYYMGDPIEDAQAVRAALAEAGALPPA